MHSDTEKIVDCKGVGWDSKKAKKVLVPADTEVNLYIQSINMWNKYYVRIIIVG